MDVIEAIKARYTVRAYRPEPVSREILSEIVRAALRAPSWANTQTWELAIVGGEVMQDLKRLLWAKAMAQDGRYPDIPRPAWPPLYEERRRRNGGILYQLLGIGREDRDKELRWYAQMYSFFDAPNGIIIYTERGLSEWALLNIGLITQTVALAALSYGLGTAIIAAPVSYPGEIRQVIGLPESKQLVTAISIGYPDLTARVNEFRSEREPVENMVNWHGV